MFEKSELPEKPAPEPIQRLIGTYVQAYKARYNARPDLRGKVRGQLKTLLQDYPIDTACDLVQVFLQMDGNRGWFKTKHHDIGTLLENLNSVLSALQTGQETGKEKTYEEKLREALDQTYGQGG